MDLQLFTKWYAKYILFGFGALLLLIVPLFKGPWIGTEPFLFVRLAEQPSWYDPLSSGGIFAAYAWGTPLALWIAPHFLVTVLPFMLGIASLLLLFLILKRLNQTIIPLHLTLFLFLLSPSFLYTFSFTNSYFFAFFLALLAFFFFLQKDTKWFCVPIVMILPLFHLTITFLLLFLLFLASFLWKKDRKTFFLFLLFSSLLVSGVYYGYILSHVGIPENFAIEKGYELAFFQKIFFDLGSSHGIGIFAGFLATIGIAYAWQKKYSHLFFFFSFLFLLIFSLFRIEGLLFLNLFVCFFAARGIIQLVEIPWGSRLYKHFFVLILFLGLIFSAVSQVDRLIESEPQDNVLEGLSFLEDQEKGVVFTDYTRGSWITSIGHTTVLDKGYIFLDDAEQRIADSSTLYYSRDFEITNALFEKYDIRYVWIDSGMKEKIWSYETEGLLFILQYTKDFKKIYDKDGVEIWSVAS